MAEKSTEKKVGMWMGISILAISLVYIAFTLGNSTMMRWIVAIFGITLSIFLFIQSQIINYFQTKSYKKLNFEDFVVWITVIAATGLLLNSLLMFQALSNQAPIWLLTFSKTIGIAVAIVSAILGLIHAIYPQFK